MQGATALQATAVASSKVGPLISGPDDLFRGRACASHSGNPPLGPKQTLLKPVVVPTCAAWTAARTGGSRGRRLRRSGGPPRPMRPAGSCAAGRPAPPAAPRPCGSPSPAQPQVLLASSQAALLHCACVLHMRALGSILSRRIHGCADTDQSEVAAACSGLHRSSTGWRQGEDPRANAGQIMT